MSTFEAWLITINTEALAQSIFAQTHHAVIAYLNDLPLPTLGATASYDLILHEVSKSSNSARMA